MFIVLGVYDVATPMGSQCVLSLSCYKHMTSSRSVPNTQRVFILNFSVLERSRMVTFKLFSSSADTSYKLVPILKIRLARADLQSVCCVAKKKLIIR